MGITVILSSPILSEVELIADDIGIISSGKWDMKALWSQQEIWNSCF